MDEQLRIIGGRGGPRSVKRAAWQEIMRQFDDSGLGATDFCRQQGISPKRFFKWKAKLKMPGEEPVRFIEIAAVPGAAAGRIEIGLGAARILLPPDAVLAEVLRACKEAAC